MKLIMVKGLPASGKSTWAKKQCDDLGYKRVNKDDLREMIDNGKWSRKNEKDILCVRNIMVDWFLTEGHTVVVDDCNLAPKHETDLRIIAEDNGADFEIKDFTDVPLETCLERDRTRALSVGRKVIMNMYNQFLKPPTPVIEWNPKLDSAVICDLDGTLCLFGDANPYDRDFSKDEMNQTIANILSTHLNVIFTSGRSEKHRVVTENWLIKHGFVDGMLFMRPEGDNRKDAIVKRELYEIYIKDRFNIEFVLDDRNQVVDMWRDLGLTCLQVAPGDF